MKLGESRPFICAHCPAISHHSKPASRTQENVKSVTDHFYGIFSLSMYAVPHDMFITVTLSIAICMLARIRPLQE
jgi:hypothetical protein